MISCNGTVVGGRQTRVQPRKLGRQESNRSVEYVGDSCEGKEESSFRIVTQNINGIGQVRNNVKEKAVKEFISDYNIDIMALQQLDVSWDKVKNAKKI